MMIVILKRVVNGSILYYRGTIPKDSPRGPKITAETSVFAVPCPQCGNTGTHKMSCHFKG